ncbi:SPOSA6832_00836 [Sporobolomyces salmonicolor]|uniref:SPOSA6832_00836-mRNA-1:cds n=1 Tax=Sporidiobolus salmonicolor TaxID=5005 RepID=A0A0D6EIA9_SPOSA|nr:SPOSA6832_00836 [Sporobolomyces salmonicolor]
MKPVNYDSDKADARLIGIEYVIHHDIFVSLPEEEKKYWHSHKYEVESGQLTLQSKSLVPTGAEDVAEQSAMTELHKANDSLWTYGKTIHTWAIDSSPSLPLGPPRLMMAFTADAQVSDSVISTVESVEQKSVAHKRELRAKYLDLNYEKAEGADQWEKTGKALELVAKEKDVTMPGREGATWKGKERLESVLGGNA